jgi:hypothetical protein
MFFTQVVEMIQRTSLTDSIIQLEIKKRTGESDQEVIKVKIPGIEIERRLIG